MVPDLLEAQRVYTFIEGLLEPLRGLLKSSRPSMLQEAILCTRDVHGAISKTRMPFATWTPFPQRGHDTGPPPREPPKDGGNWMMRHERTSRGGGCASFAGSPGHQAISALLAKHIILRSFQIVSRRKSWSKSVVWEMVRV